ncbi:MAG: bifunctional 3-deoxy-7-phosphoheptulonate synthase/chorismate mutase type II [Bacteroidota bacterium]|nr:bifunctional 3-deoxy-7-phosphoheptulonate synthase/chorismate mutase type II [Bacteroidota bacterium]
MEFKPAIQKSSGDLVSIFGPCSAESPEQLDLLLNQLGDIKPDLLRAGVWKPRTRPGHFQGMGEEALAWLVEIKHTYQIKIATEVATTEHVEACLKAGIDVLWLGARTTVNPFYVQEIAESLRGVDIPVMVKNPLNPDLHLWLGAIERLYKCGIEKLAAVHRGFSFYGNSIYRNVPRWQIPLELRRQLPTIQLIADISHISGTPEHLYEIAQIALDLNYDGLMIEVHPNPSQALSDADQQITPEFLRKNILSRLSKRNIYSDNSQFNNKIQLIRSQIDQIDLSIINLLAERMNLSESIGLEKKQNQIAIFQPDRWEEIIQKLLKAGISKGLTEEFIFSLIEAIHIESIQHQSHKMNTDDD